MQCTVDTEESKQRQKRFTVAASRMFFPPFEGLEESKPCLGFLLSSDFVFCDWTILRPLSVSQFLFPGGSLDSIPLR